MRWEYRRRDWLVKPLSSFFQDDAFFFLFLLLLLLFLSPHTYVSSGLHCCMAAAAAVSAQWACCCELWLLAVVAVAGLASAVEVESWLYKHPANILEKGVVPQNGGGCSDWSSVWQSLWTGFGHSCHSTHRGALHQGAQQGVTDWEEIGWQSGGYNR